MASRSVIYNFLGNTGLKVSNICLGTMTFGDHPGGRPSSSEGECHAILDRYAQLGGNFIDTADLYQAGQAETIIGNWLSKRRDRQRFVIATKANKQQWDKTDPNSCGASRRHLLWSVEQSLKRLQTDYIDIFYVHVWDEGTPITETLSALDYLVNSGKVMYVGFCNTKGYHLQKMADLVRERGLQPIVCLQQQYSLLCRSVEWEVSEVCRNENIALLPWSPLKGGWLSGKIKPGDRAPPSDSRVHWATGRASHSHPDWDAVATDNGAWKLLETMEAISKATGRTIAQIAIRWLLQQRVVPSVVIGARTMAQLEDNMGAAAGWTLSEEQMKELDAASQIPAPYPYDYIKSDNRMLDRERDDVTHL